MSERRTTGRVLAIYLAAAAIVTYPLVTSMFEAVPHDLGDPLVYVWLIWWNARQVPFSASWWDGPQFFPATGSLAFSGHLVGVSLLTSPLVWMGLSPAFAYNVAFLLSFTLSAWTGYLLCRELTDDRPAAFVGGLAFGFAPYRLAHLAHLDVLSAYWMPLALVGLHRFRRTGKAVHLAIFAVSWLLQVLCNGYAFFHLSALVLLWMLWFTPPWREPRAAAAIGAAWISVALPLAPVLLKYREIHDAYGLRREGHELEAFSADVASIFDASPLLAPANPVFGGGPETWLYPGVALVVTIALAVGMAMRARRVGHGRPYRRLRILLAVLAAAAALVAVSAVTFGPWRVELGPWRLSVSSVHKPLAIAWICLLALLATSARLRDAFQRHSFAGFYACAALATWVLSLGPTPRVFGTSVWYKAPYSLLLELPGFGSLRVPARFWLCSILCLAAVAALALAYLRSRAPSLKWALVSVVGAAVLWEGWPERFPLESVPPRSAFLESGRRVRAVLELPLGGFSDSKALYRSVFHGRPLVNGYSGHEPPHYAILRLGLARQEADVLTALAARHPMFVYVERSADPDSRWRGWLERQPGVALWGRDVTGDAYLVPSAASELAKPGPPLPIRSVRANRGTHARALIDGDLRTRWTTGAPQSGSTKVVADLGSEQPVGALAVWQGPYPRDFPRELVVELSSDGSQWIEAWRGPTAARALAGCLDDPATIPMIFGLGDRRARFVRLRQTAVDPTYYWSMAEIAVYQPPPRPLLGAPARRGERLPGPGARPKAVALDVARAAGPIVLQ